MNTTAAHTLSDKTYRFPIEIISHTGFLYHRFNLGYGDMVELLTEWGVLVPRIPAQFAQDIGDCDALLHDYATKNSAGKATAPI